MMLDLFKRLICKYKGHNFEAYEYHYGMYPTDIEMAGHCKRCGYDTHEVIK